MSESGYSLQYPWLPERDTHVVVCCLCNGSNPTEQVYTFTLNDAEFAIVHCVKDDLLFLSPQPGEEYAEALYNHPSYFGGQEDMYGHPVTEEKGKATGALRLKEIEERVGLPKKLLEIGCGLGYTLQVAQESGVEVLGVEFSQASVEACNKRGVLAVLATIDNPVTPEISTKGPYDLIALYSVLEHVPNPKEFLASIHPLLSSNGKLVIRVPRMSKEGPWLSLLDHFWHFTPDSLVALLKAEGFEKDALFPSGTFVGTSHGGSLESMTLFTK